MQSTETQTMLVDSVHFEFGSHVVLQSAYITSTTGRVTGLLGRNGSGKSCLFKSIMGGIKPQNPFIPSRTTLHEAFKLYGVDYDELVRFSVKFHQFQHRVFGELSGGEARLVELFLVLNAESDFCILDEPFSNIAPVYVERIQEMIQEKKHHKGIIISDHLYEEIIEITDELFVLHDGYTFPIKGKEDLIKHGYIPR